MKRALIPALLMLAVIFYACSESDSGTEPDVNVGYEVGQTAPNFTVETIDGSFTLKKYRGKIVMLDFWAGWCGPCKKTMPDLAQIYDDYKADGIILLGLSLDYSHAGWTKYVSEHNMTWRQTWDSSRTITKLYNVTGIPRNVIIDKKGKIIANQTRSPHMIKYRLDSLLNK